MAARRDLDAARERLATDPIEIRRCGVKGAGWRRSMALLARNLREATAVVKLFKSLILLVPPPWLEQGTSRSTI
jgi:hypothetical protein